ncbi:MAG: S1 RNA-binding domain-containing protein, partial [Thermoflexales bacterium]|nr:S1 RNA-binding domain-containing protein [Thermoflexales bacterium]
MTMNDTYGQAQVEESYWQALLNDSEMGLDCSTADRGQLLERAEGISSLELEDLWRSAQQVMESGELQHVQIVGHNRGGVLADWHGLRAFVPASHMICLSPLLDADARQAELAGQVGKIMALRIIEVEREQERLVMSERTLTSSEDQALLTTLAPGQIRQGVVTNVCSFGAFVDLGGLEGLIHISEISWGRVGQPGDVLASGQVVDVYIISVDPAQRRVALSLKRLQPDPWTNVEDRYRIGQLIKGEVTNVV